SPSGDTILLNRVDPSLNTSSLEVLDSKSLAKTSSWNVSPPLYGEYSISDFAVASADTSQKHAMIMPFVGDNWVNVASSGRPGCIHFPTFVSNDLLATFICKQFVTASLSDSVTVIDTLNRTEYPDGAFAVSRDGKVVALSLNLTENENRFLSEPKMRILGKR